MVFHYCVEIQAGDAEDACAQSGGIHLASCPGGAVGTCTYVLGDVSSEAFFYGEVTEAAIRSICRDGVYMPGSPT
jgi:hypothetical protein